MSSNQAILSDVIGILFLLIVLNDQLIKPVEIKRNISTKIEWNPVTFSCFFCSPKKKRIMVCWAPSGRDFVDSTQPSSKDSA
jgi:hypothetical protein